MSIVGSMLLALVAIGLAMPRLVASGATWADPAGAAVFAAIGVLTLVLIKIRRQTP